MDLHQLAEVRSLAIHAQIARQLAHDASVVQRARDTLQRWRRDGRIAPEYADQWEHWLTREVQDLTAFLTDEGEDARALRQNSPFVGIIDPRTRWTIWRDVRRQAER